MTSDSINKTLAFLARRVGALEKQAEELDKAITAMEANQEHFRPIIEAIFKGIERNGLDHDKILRHLGIE